MSVYTSATSGNWSDTATWLVDGVEPATPPAANDTVRIAPGHTVVIDTSTEINSGGSITTQVSGGGGSTGVLQIDWDLTVGSGGSCDFVGGVASPLVVAGGFTIGLGGEVIVRATSRIGEGAFMYVDGGTLRILNGQITLGDASVLALAGDGLIVNPQQIVLAGGATTGMTQIWDFDDVVGRTTGRVQYTAYAPRSGTPQPPVEIFGPAGGNLTFDFITRGPTGVPDAPMWIPHVPVYRNGVLDTEAIITIRNNYSGYSYSLQVGAGDAGDVTFIPYAMTPSSELGVNWYIQDVRGVALEVVTPAVEQGTTTVTDAIDAATTTVTEAIDAATTTVTDAIDAQTTTITEAIADISTSTTIEGDQISIE